MAVINTKQKWLYLMEPHTASRAVAEVLQKLGGSKIGHHHVSVRELTDSRRQHIHPKQLQDYKIICTVRNPFDVLVTRYKYSGQGGMTREKAERVAKHNKMTPEEVLNSKLNVCKPFDEWAYTVNKALQGLYKEATHFVYYEHLDEDLSRTFSREIVVPTDPKHVTDGKYCWQTYYDHQPDLVDYLREKFTPFMNRFGYRLFMSQGGLIGCYVDNGVQERLCRPI